MFWRRCGRGARLDWTGLVCNAKQVQGCLERVPRQQTGISSRTGARYLSSVASYGRWGWDSSVIWGFGDLGPF